MLLTAVVDELILANSEEVEEFFSEVLEVEITEENQAEILRKAIEEMLCDSFDIDGLKQLYRNVYAFRQTVDKEAAKARLK